MDRNRKRSLIGIALLIVSTLMIFAIVQTTVAPVLLGTIAAIGMAIGALLVGTAGDGRSV